jgi:hypothetical protein
METIEAARAAMERNMEIHFTTATQYSSDDLRRWISTEYDQRDGVWAGGYDEAFYDSQNAGAASLALPEGETGWQLCHGRPDAGPAPMHPDDISWFRRQLVTYAADGSGAVAHDNDRLAVRAPTWITAWSSFTYSLIGREDADFSNVLSPKPGRDIWIYRGARRGFLAQSLLPPMPDPQVSWVSGTHGEFSGPDALERYSAAADRIAA